MKRKINLFYVTLAHHVSVCTYMLGGDNKLTPLRKIILKNLIVAQLVKKLLTLYGTRRLTIVLNTTIWLYFVVFNVEYLEVGSTTARNPQANAILWHKIVVTWFCHAQS
jgi:hypothetical protein